MKKIIIWENTFIINCNNHEEIEAINFWCEKNCNGQWMTIELRYHRMSDGAVKIKCPAKYLYHDDFEYSPAQIDLIGSHIYSFEKIEDATSFKLVFEESEETIND